MTISLSSTHPAPLIRNASQKTDSSLRKISEEEVFITKPLRYIMVLHINSGSIPDGITSNRDIVLLEMIDHDGNHLSDSVQICNEPLAVPTSDSGAFTRMEFKFMFMKNSYAFENKPFRLCIKDGETMEQLYVSVAFFTKARKTDPVPRSKEINNGILPVEEPAHLTKKTPGRKRMHNEISAAASDKVPTAAGVNKEKRSINGKRAKRDQQDSDKQRALQQPLSVEPGESCRMEFDAGRSCMGQPSTQIPSQSFTDSFFHMPQPLSDAVLNMLLSPNSSGSSFSLYPSFEGLSDFSLAHAQPQHETDVFFSGMLANADINCPNFVLDSETCSSMANDYASESLRSSPALEEDAFDVFSDAKEQPCSLDDSEWFSASATPLPQQQLQLQQQQQCNNPNNWLCDSPLLM